MTLALRIEIRDIHCRCHPETCACAPCELLLDGERVATGPREGLEKLKARVLLFEQVDGVQNPLATKARWKFARIDGHVDVLGSDSAALRKRVSELQSKLLIAAAALATIRKSPEACAHINVPMLDAAMAKGGDHRSDAAIKAGAAALKREAAWVAADLSNADAERCAAAVILAPIADAQIEAMRLRSVGEEYAHRLATMLECALLNRLGSWDEGHALLHEYRAACAEASPPPPTFMGEPLPG